MGPLSISYEKIADCHATSEFFKDKCYDEWALEIFLMHRLFNNLWRYMHDRNDYNIVENYFATVFS